MKVMGIIVITWNGRECGKFEPSPVAFGRRDTTKKNLRDDCGFTEDERGKTARKKKINTEDAGHDFSRWRSEKQRFLGGHIFIGICTNNNDVSGGSSIGVCCSPPLPIKFFFSFLSAT